MAQLSSNFPDSPWERAAIFFFRFWSDRAVRELLQGTRPWLHTPGLQSVEGQRVGISLLFSEQICLFPLYVLAAPSSRTTETRRPLVCLATRATCGFTSETMVDVSVLTV